VAGSYNVFSKAEQNFHGSGLQLWALDDILTPLFMFLDGVSVLHKTCVYNKGFLKISNVYLRCRECR
jgi:hypothetical protein